MMTELNPQLRRELRVLDASPEIIPSITCIRTDYDPILKEALIKSLGRLHEEPRGRQILMLFKVDRLVPFRESHLEGIQELLKRHGESKKKLVSQLSRQDRKGSNTKR